MLFVHYDEEGEMWPEYRAVQEMKLKGLAVGLDIGIEWRKTCQGDTNFLDIHFT